MREILLSRDKVALVDDNDYEALNRFTWSSVLNEGIYYASRAVPRPSKSRVFMHCQIMDWFNGIDHIDRDGLNNQRSNLRHATASQNGANRKKQANASSKYKGVSWNTSKRKWHAQIQVQGKLKHLGWFKEEEAAALAYNAAARTSFNEFARVNEVPS